MTELTLTISQLHPQCVFYYKLC